MVRLGSPRLGLINLIKIATQVAILFNKQHPSKEKFKRVVCLSVVRQLRSSEMLGFREAKISERGVGVVCRWSKRTPVPVGR
jgi:hypothetical protein